MASIHRRLKQALPSFPLMVMVLMAAVAGGCSRPRDAAQGAAQRAATDADTRGGAAPSAGSTAAPQRETVRGATDTTVSPAAQIVAAAVSLPEAIARLRALKTWPTLANNLAWVLATHEDPQVRLPLLAGELALEAQQLGGPTPTILDTLAAAQAAQGEARQAVATIDRAVREFAGQLDDQRRESMLRRRAIYAAGMAYCEPYSVPLQRGTLAGEALSDRLEAYRFLVLADLLWAAGNQAESLTALAMAVAHDGGYRRARLALGQALVDRALTEAAVEQFLAVLADDRHNAEALAGLAAACGQVNDTAGMIAVYRRLLAVRPEPVVQNNLAWLLATCEQDHLRQGDEALRLAQNLCRASPDDPQLLDTLAAAQAECGRFDDAAATLDRALARLENARPQDPEQAVHWLDLYTALHVRRRLYAMGHPYRNEVQAHRQLGRSILEQHPVAAERHFKYALALAPEDAEAAFLLGVARARLGQTLEAAGLFAQAVARHGDWYEAVNNLVWLVATMPEPDEQWLATAVEKAEHLVARSDAPPAEFFDTLAVAYAAAQRHQEAVAALDRALALLGEDDARRRDYELRRELFAAGLRFTTVAEAHRLLAEHYAARGQAERAGHHRTAAQRAER